MTRVDHACFGRADPLACESRWTHTLPNFKMTILRKIIYNIGVDAVELIEAPSTDKTFNIDGETISFNDFHQQIQGVRVKRTKDYVTDEATFPQLCVLTVLLDSFDSKLLYPLLGDMLPKKDSEGKLP